MGEQLPRAQACERMPAHVRGLSHAMLCSAELGYDEEHTSAQRNVLGRHVWIVLAAWPGFRVNQGLRHNQHCLTPH